MEKKKVVLSVAIATFNEEQNLLACLSSVKEWVDEVVVVDGGSTDESVKIAKSFGAQVIKTINPPIFHINKQKALDACNGEWILQLDADEIVTPELSIEIREIIHESRINGYYIPRKNYFLGHWLRKGGQYPDYVIRFFKHGKGKFPCKSVHEQIEIEGDTGYMKNHILHYSYKTVREYWKKADIYTSLEARELQQLQIPTHIFSFINYYFIKPTHTFLNIFVRHKGYVDGWHGLLYAIFSGLHYQVAYMKYIHLKQSA